MERKIWEAYAKRFNLEELERVWAARAPGTPLPKIAGIGLEEFLSFMNVLWLSYDLLAIIEKRELSLTAEEWKAVDTIKRILSGGKV